MAVVNNLIPRASTYGKATLNPTQTAYQTNLLGQVKSGGIQQSQYDAEMKRYLGAEGATPPLGTVTPTPAATPAVTTPATVYKPIPTNLNPEQTAYRQNLAGQVASKGITQGQMDAELRRYLGLDGSTPAVATPAATPAAAAPAAPTPQQALRTDSTNSITSNLQGLLKAQPSTPIYGTDTSGYFPNVRAFEPKNYEGSPLYQFQKNEGLKALQNTLAARGLTGSGAELEAQNRFITQLGAQETERMSNVAQTEADRLERMQQNEALRRERSEGSQFDRIYQILSLLQQQNPAEYTYRAAEHQADLEVEKAKLLADYQSRLIPPAVSSGRGRSSGGGGGGGTAVPGAADPGPYIPSAAGGPDFSGIDRAAQAANAASNADTYKSILGILSQALG